MVNDKFATHNIPHHSAEEDSPTMPIHIVFDCSFQQISNLPSVNDIPHHSAEKDSPTMPIHIAFDCSCQQMSNLPSLNDS